MRAISMGTEFYIAQEKPSTFRIYGMLNPLSWLVYDIYSWALVNSIMRVGIFTSALIAKIRLDWHKKEDNQNLKLSQK